MAGTPAFIFQAQQNFRFERTDPIVAYYLDEVDLDAVTHWQVESGYTFEFHEGHTTGYPIYIRPDGNTSSTNMTKFDTNNIVDPTVHYKNKMNAAKPWIQEIPNFSVISGLGARRIGEIVSIMTHEWAALQKLALRRWTNWKKPMSLMERALATGQYPPRR